LTREINFNTIWSN